MKSLLLVACLLCALRVGSGQRAVAFFNRGGFTGPVVFYQNSTNLYVDFSRLNFTTTGDIEVDVHPVPVQIGQTTDPCADSVIGDHETPAVTPALTMATKTTLVTSSRVLVGPNGLLGRSLAMHQGINTPACATITHIPADRVTNPLGCGTGGYDDQGNELEAVFNGRISGRVSLRALQNTSLTSVVSHLFYTDGTATTTGNSWRAYFNNCSSLGRTRQNFTTSHGAISVGAAGMEAPSHWVSSGEVAAPFLTLIGKPLAIHNGTSGAVIACASIARTKRRAYTANFDSAGTVRIRGNSRLSSSAVDIQLKSTPASITIQQYASSESCVMSGSTFNPFNRADQNMSGMTPDQYPTGSIGQKFPLAMASQQCDNSVSLFGVNSVARRSVSITVNGMRTCSNLVQDLGAGDQLLQAKAIFNSGPVRGTMTLQQVRNSDGTMGITTLTSSGLMSTSGSATMDHYFHVHVSRKGYQNTTAACAGSFAQGHYNPFNVDTSAASNYATDCGPTNQLRCEVGDTSRKTGTLNVDSSSILRQDTYMPLMGSESVLGRSIIIHGAGRVAPRYACANIIPMSARDVQIGVRTSRLPSGGFSATAFRDLVRRSSSFASNVDVLYAQAYTDDSNGCTYVSTAIDGANAECVASGLSRAALGTAYSQNASECTEGVTFSTTCVSSAGTLFYSFSLAVSLATAACALIF